MIRKQVSALLQNYIAYLEGSANAWAKGYLTELHCLYESLANARTKSWH